MILVDLVQVITPTLSLTGYAALALRSDDAFQETSARYREVEPSSGSNVIPRRARPGLAGLGPHKLSNPCPRELRHTLAPGPGVPRGFRGRLLA